MATRYGRRLSDGTYEYHDSRESLLEAERRETSQRRAEKFGLWGAIVGGVVAAIVLHQIGNEMPKWLRFGLVIGAGAASAWVLAKFADAISTIFTFAIGLAVIGGIGAVIWKLV